MLNFLNINPQQHFFLSLFLGFLFSNENDILPGSFITLVYSIINFSINLLKLLGSVLAEVYWNFAFIFCENSLTSSSFTSSYSNRSILLPIIPYICSVLIKSSYILYQYSNELKVFNFDIS